MILLLRVELIMQPHVQKLPPSLPFRATRERGWFAFIRAFLATLIFLATVAGLSMLAWFTSGSLAKDHEVKLLERERIMRPPAKCGTKPGAEERFKGEASPGIVRRLNTATYGLPFLIN